MESSLTNWTAIGDAVNGVPLPPASATLLAEATSGNGEGILRPAASRQDSTASLIVLRKTVQDFKFGDILGEGSYSTVSLVTDKHPPHRSYALKVLDKEHIKREKKTKYVLIERDTLKALDGHPGINGELLKWIKKFGSFSLPCARFYAAQILSAVEHIHSKGVIHRDLKPENILLDDHMRIKVTDFGTAKQLEDNAQDAPPKARTRSFVGTPEYVSPEILSEGKESSKSDYWGFGCILFQMLAGRPPFQARTEYLMFQKIIKLEYEFPPEFPDDAKDLVQKLLVLDPTERLGGTEEGIEAIKRHPFFTSDPGAIDFSTIWKVEPPTLETGIAPPKEVVTGEFVLADSMDSFGAAVDDDNSDFDGRSELRGSSLGHSEESAGLRNGGGASGAVAALTAVRSNGNGHTIASPPEPITKW
ncbi:kinase-like protein [Meredithblackwellia eburnea MCA 4105]